MPAVPVAELVASWMSASLVYVESCLAPTLVAGAGWMFVSDFLARAKSSDDHRAMNREIVATMVCEPRFHHAPPILLYMCFNLKDADWLPAPPGMKLGPE